MSGISDDDEIIFNRQKPANSFEAIPVGSSANLNDMEQDDIDEQERIKKEIWAEVEAAKKERLRKEEAAKKKKAMERKKLKERKTSSGAEEVSQKVLDARKKLEDDRKRFRQLRMQNKQKKPASEDVVLVSPAKSPAASRIKKDPVIEIAAAPASKPRAVVEEEKPKPKPEPVPSPEPVKETPVAEVESPVRPAAAAATSQVTPNARSASKRSSTPSGSNDVQKWKRAYHSLKGKYEAEIEGKSKLQQALSEYDLTVTDMVTKSKEQEATIASLQQQLAVGGGNAQDGDGASEEAVRAATDRAEEIAAREAVTRAELEAVQAQSTLLTQKLDASEKQRKSAVANEAALQQQIATLSSGDTDDMAAKFTSFQQASSRHAKVMQLQLERMQAQNRTLQLQLEARSQENADLTQICDQLVKMLEAAEQ